MEQKQQETFLQVSRKWKAAGDKYWSTTGRISPWTAGGNQYERSHMFSWTCTNVAGGERLIAKIPLLNMTSEMSDIILHTRSRNKVGTKHQV